MRLTIPNGQNARLLCDLTGSCGESALIIQTLAGGPVNLSTNPALDSATIDATTGFLDEGFVLPDPKNFVATIKLIPFADKMYARVAAGLVDAVIDFQIVKIGKGK